MQALVQSSEQYLTEQREGVQKSWKPKHQEEEESEGSHMSSGDLEIPPPGQLKHSDSLLLLTQVNYSVLPYFFPEIFSTDFQLNFFVFRYQIQQMPWKMSCGIL